MNQTKGAPLAQNEQRLAAWAGEAQQLRTPRTGSESRDVPSPRSPQLGGRGLSTI